METLDDKRATVIVAAGEFPKHQVPLDILERHRRQIICCDGAADELLAKGYMPQVIVGDGDSISEQTRMKSKRHLIINQEQETNDLTKAVNYCVAHGMKKLVILGATGKREDHTLGNISLLVDYMDIADVRMYTDYGCLFPLTGKCVLNTFAGQQLSFFCLDSSPLTLKDVRWPLEKRTITRWWQATLNEALANTATIETEGKIVVFSMYPFLRKGEGRG